MKPARCFCAVALLPMLCAAGPYVQDFEKVSPGDPPAELMVLNGKFEVKKVEGGQAIEVPGEPLESFGFFFGPDGAAACGARIQAERTGKRFPEFGVGLGGAAGWRLWLIPAVGELQIVQENHVAARLPFAWTSGSWTLFRFRARSAGGGKWVLEGKAWEQGKAEPGDWMIRHETSEDPTTGRPSTWGTPYSGKPIRFDDLTVAKE